MACGLLSSCGACALERTGSVVVASGLSCPAACGILVPRSGIKSESPALEGRFLTTGPPGKFQSCFSFKVPSSTSGNNNNNTVVKIY